MVSPAKLSEGVGVLHLFWRTTPAIDRDAVLAAVAKAEAAGDQIVMVAMLGHKADIAMMAVGEDMWRLRQFQTAMAKAGLQLVDSYVSITELSEYTANLPEQMKNARLYPQFPIPDKQAWCFYPMSKRRTTEENWYTLPFERRLELMMEHGTSGRAFAGRLVQLITASTGLDEYEWGVTLFATNPDDLKDVVYTMRFDEASARYADFGPFYTGMVAAPEEVLASVGVE